MKQAVLLILEIATCVLVTDFVSGLLHWLEDAYGREDFPITGRLFTKPNMLHHQNPRAFVRNSWWRSSWDLLCISAAIVFIAWLFGCLTWHVWLFAALGTNANQIHKWAHRSQQENGWLISFLQYCRILQSPRHHAHHHSDPKNSHYCVLTDFLNPVLDRMGFWTALERMIWRLFGIPRRPDPSVRTDAAERERLEMPSCPVSSCHEHSSRNRCHHPETVPR